MTRLPIISPSGHTSLPQTDVEGKAERISLNDSADMTCAIAFAGCGDGEADALAQVCGTVGVDRG